MSAEEVKFYKALGDETRLSIVKYLLENSSCACEFTRVSQKDQTTISRHLKVLTEAGILKREKLGRNRIYDIADEKTRERLLNMGLKPEKIESPCCTKPEEEIIWKVEK